MTQPPTFDIAISFAGSERDYAGSIQEILTENGIKFIYRLHSSRSYGWCLD